MDLSGLLFPKNSSSGDIRGSSAWEPAGLMAPASCEPGLISPARYGVLGSLWAKAPLGMNDDEDGDCLDLSLLNHELKLL